MAELATLEGAQTGISLDDLFNGNDYLGVKYFGVDDWNKIKKYACEITRKAAKNPVLFYVDSLKVDYPTYQESPLSKAIFGFNDAYGAAAFGSVPWGRLKVKLDNELLGGLWEWTKDAVKGGLDYLKKATNAPFSVLEWVYEETPMQYLPMYSLMYNYMWKPLDNIKDYIGEGIEKTQDFYSFLMQKLWVDNPVLSWTPTGKLVKEIEEAKEEVHLTTPGTAGVYESEAQKEKREEQERQTQAAAAEAMAKASYLATAQQAQNIKQAKTKKAYQEQIAQRELALSMTQKELEEQQRISSSKYLPIILGGSALLVALSIFKKK